MKAAAEDAGRAILQHVIGRLVDVSVRTGRLGEVDDAGKAELREKIIDAFVCLLAAPRDCPENDTAITVVDSIDDPQGADSDAVRVAGR